MVFCLRLGAGWGTLLLSMFWFQSEMSSPESHNQLVEGFRKFQRWNQYFTLDLILGVFYCWPNSLHSFPSLPSLHPPPPRPKENACIRLIKDYSLLYIYIYFNADHYKNNSLFPDFSLLSAVSSFDPRDL